MENGGGLLVALAAVVMLCFVAAIVRSRRRRKEDVRREDYGRREDDVRREGDGGRVGPAVAGWRERRRRRRTIARLDRAVGADSIVRGIDLTEFDRDGRRPLEEIAADLRRLRAYRVGRGGRPIVWPLLLIEAYDDRLRLACRYLGVPEHLADLDGVDREIERVRVEGELHAAGLPLPAAVAEHRQRHH
ncbi:hypothetical protein O7606_16410 [Micromonospora sp. WMMD882]|uniref:hypothetical protein n=1 Tax=Micromonospora sp. WMMD882 TaxID=3015151 RepID=UPI00248AEC96|nr:hypothetical protein [Micromonospora sp. WMMD882]WBB77848.1 hypothetical protein O7606_16410 [Micromonospora sp. WMMD882]